MQLRQSAVVDVRASRNACRIVGIILFAAAVAGCATAPREPVSLTVPDYGVSIALADTRWHLAGSRSLEHDYWRQYHWLDIPDRANEADVQVTLQHVADAPSDLTDLPSWSDAAFDGYLDLYTGGYDHEQDGETRTQPVTLASGQQVAIEHRTYVINGHVREVATAAFEDQGVRVFVWIANEGLTAPLDGLAPRVLEGIALDAPAAP